MTKNFKRNLIVLVLIVAGVLGIVFFQKKNEPNQEVLITLGDYILGSFLAELPEINKNLPRKVDDRTVLLSIKYESKKIVSVYEVASFDKGSEVMAEIDQSVKKQVCDDPMRKKLLDVEIQLLNRYQYKSGSVAFEIAIDKNSCFKVL